MGKSIAVFAAFILMAQAAWADTALRDYQKGGRDKAAEEKLTYYIAGVGRGMMVHGIALDLPAGTKQFFCAPEEEGAYDFRVILDTYIKNHPAVVEKAKQDTSISIEVVMLYALGDKFPCKK
jgi:hypothetical protein